MTSFAPDVSNPPPSKSDLKAKANVPRERDLKDGQVSFDKQLDERSPGPVSPKLRDVLGLLHDSPTRPKLNQGNSEPISPTLQTTSQSRNPKANISGRSAGTTRDARSPVPPTKSPQRNLTVSVNNRPAVSSESSPMLPVLSSPVMTFEDDLSKIFGLSRSPPHVPKSAGAPIDRSNTLSKLGRAFHRKSLSGSAMTMTPKSPKTHKSSSSFSAEGAKFLDFEKEGRGLLRHRRKASKASQADEITEDRAMDRLQASSDTLVIENMLANLQARLELVEKENAVLILQQLRKSE